MNKLHEISTPTLILHGKNDTITPIKLAQELHEGIKDSKLTAFDGGHLFLFKNQKEFADCVTEFLNEQ
jgi:pimeloyl-ACP methyl ester carboxylesterase